MADRLRDSALFMLVWSEFGRGVVFDLPVIKLVPASLLGGASRNKPCQRCWPSYRSSTPRAQLSWMVWY
jgi:hypothetical protein